MVTDKNKGNVETGMEASTSCLEEAKLAEATKSISAKVELSSDTALSVTSSPGSFHAASVGSHCKTSHLAKMILFWGIIYSNLVCPPPKSCKTALYFSMLVASETRTVHTQTSLL